MFTLSSGSKAAIAQSLGRNSAFARKLRTAAESKIEAILNDVGARAVELAEAHIAADFDNARPPERRRRPGSRHLAGSMRYRVHVPAPGAFATVELYSEADPERVAALEFGSPPHEITGSPLAFPRGGAEIRPPRGLASREGPTFGRRDQLTVVPSVQHPGNRPYRFMDRALKQAIREILASAR